MAEFNRRQFAEDVRELSTISNLRSATAIASEYALLGGSIGLAIWSGHWLIYLAAAVVISARQQALGVLIHDAAHYRLFSNRRVNDLVSDLFLAFPLGVSTSLYRRYHAVHHRFVNDEEQDPDRSCVHDDHDWEWPKTTGEAMRLFVRDLTGMSILSHAKMIWLRYSIWPHLLPGLMRDAEHKPGLRDKLLLLTWFVPVAVGLYLTNAWLYAWLLWMVPSCTILAVIFRVRMLAEHYGLDDSHELHHSRTVIASAWEKFLLCPYGVNYHLELHLFPSVPFFKLHRLHHRLMQNPVYAQHAHLTNGYLAVVGELLKASETPSTLALEHEQAVA